MDAVNRKRVGLALSGGIARGPAHVGVLAVLEEAGLPIDVVAGVSAGSLVGALHCAGWRAAQMHALVAELGWRQVARPLLSSEGFVSFEKLEQWLVTLIGEVQFHDLKKPFAVTATDLHTGEPVTFREGCVARVVHASCAVPGFVEPVEIDGHVLGDGGASNNLPVAAARTLGAEVVIGVDLFRPAHRPALGPMRYGLNALENFVRRSGGGLDSADVVISPKLDRASYFSFGRSAALRAVALGARAAADQLAEIRAASASVSPAPVAPDASGQNPQSSSR
jgi:NTE family protein